MEKIKQKDYLALFVCACANKRRLQQESKDSDEAETNSLLT